VRSESEPDVTLARDGALCEHGAMTTPPVPAPDPRTVYLHIGAFKTGTTYLQQVLHANRERLAADGILMPGDLRHQQVFAARDLLGKLSESKVSGAWNDLTRDIREWDGHSALVTAELLSMAGVRHARRAVRSLQPAEVHVVLTARDLARVVPAMWQESLKAGHTWTWEEYISGLRDPGAASRPPALGFWICQDLPALLDIWGAAVPRERIHIVTVPPPGSSETLLLERFCKAVGIDAGALTVDTPWVNRSVGAAGAEALRRLNAALDGRLNRPQYVRVCKHVIARTLAETTTSSQMTLPAEHRAWAVERGREMVNRIRERGYLVVGDLEELVPLATTTHAAGRSPDETNDTEVLDATMRALTEVTEQFARRSRVGRNDDDTRSAQGSSRARIGTAVRGAEYKTKRAAADLAGRSRLAGRAATVLHRAMLRRRSRVALERGPRR
jgi:hypothetical protein